MASPSWPCQPGSEMAPASSPSRATWVSSTSRALRLTVTAGRVAHAHRRRGVGTGRHPGWQGAVLPLPRARWSGSAPHTTGRTGPVGASSRSADRVGPGSATASARAPAGVCGRERAALPGLSSWSPGNQPVGCRAGVAIWTEAGNWACAWATWSASSTCWLWAQCRRKARPRVAPLGRSGGDGRWRSACRRLAPGSGRPNRFTLPEFRSSSRRESDGRRASRGVGESLEPGSFRAGWWRAVESRSARGRHGNQPGLWFRRRSHSTAARVEASGPSHRSSPRTRSRAEPVMRAWHRIAGALTVGVGVNGIGVSGTWERRSVRGTPSAIDLVRARRHAGHYSA